MKKLIIIAVIAAGALIWFLLYRSPAVDYSPVIDPTEFTTNITNPYFSVKAGSELVYEGQTADGVERIVITVSGETKELMGVQTLIYHDRVWVGEELVEDTRDYLAQNKKTGDVWYFGEDVDNYTGGQLADHAGSWLAGVNGALPGIWMLGNPQVGDSYRQEYYLNEAEDEADVVSVTEKVTAGGKTYANCLKTYDYTRLDKNAQEYKYYCREAGGLVLEEGRLTGERVELISRK